MANEIMCKQCGKRPVNTVKKVWFIEGVLFASKRGTKTLVGCEECIRAEVMSHLREHGTKGWLSVPWGLATPFVMAQNLYEAFRAHNEDELRQLIRKRGLRPEQVTFGKKEEDDLGRGVILTLHEMIWADGDADEREIELAVEIAGQMLGDVVDADTVRKTMVQKEITGRLEIEGMDLESRVILFRAASDIAMVDGVFHKGEEAHMRALARRLDLPGSLVERLIEALHAQLDNDVERREAASLLEVKVDAPLAEVKRSYIEHKLNASGTQSELEAYDQAIQRAYETLVGAAPPQ